MSRYKKSQYARQEDLINNSDIFNGDKGNGYFMGKARPFVLRDGMNNLYQPIRNDVRKYFKDNKVTEKDFLNEGTSTRGSNCTSVDALIRAEHKDGSIWLIPIEWKYTEHYNNQDKSNEDRQGEEKGSNGKGQERVRRYYALTDASSQLKSMESYYGSVYYQEPFYQLMRQTLWAENVVKLKEEKLKADNYMHIHVIPSVNKDLLDKKYSVSGMTMEETWRSMLNDQSKYVIVDPRSLFAPIRDKYPELSSYFEKRYW